MVIGFTPGGNCVYTRWAIGFIPGGNWVYTWWVIGFTLGGRLGLHPLVRAEMRNAFFNFHTTFSQHILIFRISFIMPVMLFDNVLPEPAAGEHNISVDPKTISTLTYCIKH